MAPVDTLVFAALFDLQDRRGTGGDVLEVGVFEGRSAILLGRLLGPGERVVVCDLFGDPAPDVTNQAENRAQYGSLQRRTFEENCRRHLAVQPEVHQCPSADLVSRLPADRFRFVHLDGSHNYDVVRADIDTARVLLGPGGVVAFDDYRSIHTPGVAAAAWAAVTAGRLRVLCTTPFKLYAAFDDAEPPLDEVRARLAVPDVGLEEDYVAGRALLRVVPLPPPADPRKVLLRSLTPPVLWQWGAVRAAARRRSRLPRR